MPRTQGSLHHRPIRTSPRRSPRPSPRPPLPAAQDVYRCRNGPYSAAALEESLGCSYSDETAEAARCYFARQRSICFGDGSRAIRYKNLFGAPSTTELQQQFWDIVGDSFVDIPPAMQAAMAQVNRIGANDVFTEEASNICDESLRNSMTLDQSAPRPSELPGTTARLRPPRVFQSYSPAFSLGSRGAPAAAAAAPCPSPLSTRPCTQFLRRPPGRG